MSVSADTRHRMNSTPPYRPISARSNHVTIVLLNMSVSRLNGHPTSRLPIVVMFNVVGINATSKTLPVTAAIVRLTPSTSANDALDASRGHRADAANTIDALAPARWRGKGSRPKSRPRSLREQAGPFESNRYATP